MEHAKMNKKLKSKEIELSQVRQGPCKDAKEVKEQRDRAGQRR